MKSKKITAQLPPLKIPTKFLSETPVASNCETRTNSKQTIKLEKDLSQKADLIALAQFQHNQFLQAISVLDSKHPYWFNDFKGEKVEARCTGRLLLP